MKLEETRERTEEITRVGYITEIYDRNTVPETLSVEIDF